MLGVILPSSTKAFSIILLRQAYLGIPKELIEAAKLDGAGELKIWKNVMIPGILPSVSTIVIFDFIANWNAFLWPIIVLQDPEKYPLATALQYLNGSFSYKFGYVASGTITVSYTHLRAHETDSYLVCRLLLEKKKKQAQAKINETLSL